MVLEHMFPGSPAHNGADSGPAGSRISTHSTCTQMLLGPVLNDLWVISPSGRTVGVLMVQSEMFPPALVPQAPPR